MTAIPCFYCGDGVWVKEEAELEVAICEVCSLEVYGVDTEVEEVLL